MNHNEIYCQICGDDIEENCSYCCTHDELDRGICLDCGDDRTEWLAAAAYDRAKDSRYDD